MKGGRSVKKRREGKWVLEMALSGMRVEKDIVSIICLKSLIISKEFITHFNFMTRNMPENANLTETLVGSSKSAVFMYGNARIFVVYLSGQVTKWVGKIAGRKDGPFLFPKVVTNVHVDWKAADFSAAALPFLYLICVSCSEPAHLVPSTRSQNEVKGCEKLFCVGTCY